MKRAPLNAEDVWIAVAKRPPRRPMKSNLAPCVLLALAQQDGWRYYGDKRDMAIIGARYNKIVEAAFRRLVAAGVIRYEPRQPLRPGIIVGG